MHDHNAEEHLNQWDLYKSYGEFNIRFEGIIAIYRKFLIDLIKKYYGFNVDWEEAESDDMLPEHLQDRLLKILLHDDGAMAIIEKCRSCFIDITSEQVSSVLIKNNIEPLILNEFDIKVAEMLFKKGIELVQLRNILIHAHFEGAFFEWAPLTKLEGVKDKRVSKGYKQEHFQFDVNFLEKANQQLDVIYFSIRKLNNHIFLNDVEKCFSQQEFIKINMIDFRYT